MSTNLQSPMAFPLSYTFRHIPRDAVVALAVFLLSISIWAGLGELASEARLTLIVFGLAVIGWVGTKIDDTAIAVGAALVLAVTNVMPSEALFDTLGHPMIWLLVAAFIMAAAVQQCGLAERFTHAVIRRTRTVQGLCYALATAILLTALVIPSTSGRAALLVPVFLALREHIESRRVVRVLALLFPTAVLLSASGSLIGAGANLIAADLIAQAGGPEFSFFGWMLAAFPFAALTTYGATWILLRLFLTRTERMQPLHLDLGTEHDGPPSATARWVSRVLIGLIGLWCTEAWHGIDGTLVALGGALAVTVAPGAPLTLKAGMKAVSWHLLVFLAATLALGEALISTGVADMLAERVFQVFQTGERQHRLGVVIGVALLSLLAHLIITSRTARASVLVPMVLVLGLSLGLNPAGLAFLSTMAAGFCLTLPVSAKPVAMFSQLPGPSYDAGDLLKLSLALLPFLLAMLLLFTYTYWPMLGLGLTG